MPQERFPRGSDLSITLSAATLDGVAVTGTGTATFTLLAVNGSTLLNAVSCPWNAAKLAYIGAAVASNWTSQTLSTSLMRGTMGRLIVTLTESGVPVTFYRDAFFCED